jgi:hypothetical protein
MSRMALPELYNYLYELMPHISILRIDGPCVVPNEDLDWEAGFVAEYLMDHLADGVGR